MVKREKSGRNASSFSSKDVLAVLEGSDSSALTAKAILARLGGDPRKSSALRSLLSKMVDAGKIERSGRRYRAKRKPGSNEKDRLDWNKPLAAITSPLKTIPTGTLLLILLALVACVGLAYSNALENGFVNWDDPAYVTNNEHIRSLSWDMVKWAFTSYHASNWHPLTWISLAVDYRIFGLEAWGYHLTSLLFHILSTCLIFLTLFFLTGAVWKSAIVAALFGLHPTHVESVAWVAERKDVLCAFFWYLAIVAYTGYARTRNLGLYSFVLAVFSLGLLAKPMVITLPVILLLLDFWPLNRFSRRVILEKIPLFIAAVVSALLTLAAQTSGGAVAIDPIPLGDRITNGLFSYIKYVWLTIWPLRLSPWYSHPALEGPSLTWLLIAISASLLIGITVYSFFVRRKRPYILVGWLWYVITLIPVIGIIQIGRQGMADRYLYIPQIGLLIIAVWAASDLPVWKHRAWISGTTVFVIVLSTLGLLTHAQTKVWQNNLTLWTFTAESSPDSFVAHQALGGVLLRQNRIDEALRHYQIAVEIRPDFHRIHSRIGDILSRRGETEEAAEYYSRAVQLSPESAEYRRKLAATLTRRGNFQEALFHLQKASELEPDSSQVHYLLARAHRSLGELDNAETELRIALELNPGFKAAKSELESLQNDVQQGMSVPR